MIFFVSVLNEVKIASHKKNLKYMKKKLRSTKNVDNVLWFHSNEKKNPFHTKRKNTSKKNRFTSLLYRWKLGISERIKTSHTRDINKIYHAVKRTAAESACSVPLSKHFSESKSELFYVWYIWCRLSLSLSLITTTKGYIDCTNNIYQLVNTMKGVNKHILQNRSRSVSNSR